MLEDGDIHLHIGKPLVSRLHIHKGNEVGSVSFVQIDRTRGNIRFWDLAGPPAVSTKSIYSA